MNIRDARESDAEAIARIYNHFIRNTIITFEEDEITPADIAARIANITMSYPWLIGEEEGALLGYAYAGKFNERTAYRFSALSTIYLDEGAQGRGHGTKLYGALLDRLRKDSFRTALGGIALPNPKSVALHEKLGFKKTGYFEKVGFKFDRWIDVGYWQITL